MNIDHLKSLQRRQKITRVVFITLIFTMVSGLYLSVLLQYRAKLRLSPENIVMTNPMHQFKDSDLRINKADVKCATSVQHIDFNVATFQELKSTFVQHDFMHKIAEPDLDVPRLCLVALPKNFKQASISSKKKLFVKSLLPLILRANENILTERYKLLDIVSYHARYKKFKTTHKQWITNAAFKYRIKKINLEELKKKIDIIPPSLALGQAIIETGWGTSHSAMSKNSTFGLTVNDRVLSYDSLLASVENYMLNMNAHNAYNKMREIRSTLRHNKQKICSIKLLKGLNSYSIRRGAYLDEIENIINAHNLKAYDNAKLINIHDTL